MITPNKAEDAAVFSQFTASWMPKKTFVVGEWLGS